MSNHKEANGHINPKSETSGPADTQPNGTATPPPTQAQPAPQNQDKPKRPPTKPKRKNKNYAQIHSNPLPLKTYPLPAFNPSHPLSLLRLAYTYLSHLLSPPSSHPPCPYTGHFSAETRSVHITSPAHVRALWEMGFFGKGSLSRSEPSWFEREREVRRVEREGGSGNGTGGGVRAAEEVTRARREERRLFKLERARVEREKVERQRAVEEGREVGEEGEEGGLRGDVGGDEARVATDASPLLPLEEAIDLEPLQADRVPDAELLDAATGNESPAQAKESASLQLPPAAKSEVDDPEKIDAEPPIFNQEHLQLTLEESFFLSFALGVLQIALPDNQQPQTSSPPSSLDLLNLFAAHETFSASTTDPGSPRGRHPAIAINDQPLHARAVSHNIATAPMMHDPTPTSLKVPLTAAPLTPQPSPPLDLPEPDNKFLLNYVVYHHFRSLGWCVRPGVKFGCDFLLYNRGPVFSHAEFAVVVVPAYTDGYWSTPAGREVRRVKEAKDWWWVHCVNRVQSSVHKTLVLCYVDVPAPPREEEVGGGDDGRDGEVDVGKLLARYKVREFVVKRWLVNRSRD